MSDDFWRCMLRTGPSLPATVLIHGCTWARYVIFFPSIIISPKTGSVPLIPRILRLMQPTYLVPYIWLHRLFKIVVHKQLFLRRRTRSLEISGNQWWQVGTVRRGGRCRLGCCADTLCDVLWRYGALDIPLRTRAQDAAFGARSEHGNRAPM